jgi:hypothetical protein
MSKIAYVVNEGTETVRVNGIGIQPTRTRFFRWDKNGNGWRPCHLRLYWGRVMRRIMRSRPVPDMVVKVPKIGLLGGELGGSA